MICPECAMPVDKMCPECGIFFDEPQFVVNDFANCQLKQNKGYEHKTHFKEVLSLFQGREDYKFSQEIIDLITDALPVDRETVDVHVIRQTLKTLKLTKYAENAQNILYVVTGRQPPYIKREIEDKLMKHLRQSIGQIGRAHV